MFGNHPPRDKYLDSVKEFLTNNPGEHQLKDVVSGIKSLTRTMVLQSLTTLVARGVVIKNESNKTYSIKSK